MSDGKSLNTAEEISDLLQIDDDSSGEGSSSSSSSSSSSASSDNHAHAPNIPRVASTRTDHRHPFLEHRFESLGVGNQAVVQRESASMDTEDFHREQQQSAEQRNSHLPSASTPASAFTSLDQERQILIVMFLAQVAALHDATPRTFTVHALELFERGILDRPSIMFLFDLGLLPTVPPTTTRLLTATASSHQQSTAASQDQPARTELAVYTQGPLTVSERSLEASAIRDLLEREEREQRTNALPRGAAPRIPEHAASEQRSWSAEHHPLSLSRYRREFENIRLLSSGSFGYVYQATSKTDGQEYAIKKVPFNASGYSQSSLSQVMREVRCLAVCDHPNVVRYYTSWLEPSWMTGSGSVVTGETAENQMLDKLLAYNPELSSAVPSSPQQDDDESDVLKDYFKDPIFSSESARLPRRGVSDSDAFETSVDGCSTLFDGSGYSEWTAEEGTAGVEEDTTFRVPANDDCEGVTRKNNPLYNYQVCLFIQMELCSHVTLADWIRDRNKKLFDAGVDCSTRESIKARLPDVAHIFSQLASGLAHIHQNGIIHRDITPRNVFSNGQIQFKIGDFGLSKIKECARGSNVRTSSPNPRQPQIMFGDACSNDAGIDIKPVRRNSWQEPLTAGVGTASYAAPEQVASRTYGNEADVFSLGLILLELLCCFGTEHERIQTFQDCRYQGRLPDQLGEHCAFAARIVLACTAQNPKKRPSAETLLKADIHQEIAPFILDIQSDADPCSARKGENTVEFPGSGQREDTCTVRELRCQLSQKDEELDRCRAELAEKDDTIAELRRELERLRGSNGARKSSYTGSAARGAPFFANDTPGGVAEDNDPTSSTSEDEL